MSQKGEYESDDHAGQQGGLALAPGKPRLRSAIEPLAGHRLAPLSRGLFPRGRRCVSRLDFQKSGGRKRLRCLRSQRFRWPSVTCTSVQAKLLPPIVREVAVPKARFKFCCWSGAVASDWRFVVDSTTSVRPIESEPCPQELRHAKDTFTAQSGAELSDSAWYRAGDQSFR